MYFLSFENINFDPLLPPDFDCENSSVIHEVAKSFSLILK